MRSAPAPEVRDRMHVRQGGQVDVRLRAAVLGVLARLADGASNEHLAHAIAAPVGENGNGVRGHGNLDACDVKRRRPGGGRLVSCAPQVESVNGSLKGLDDLYGAAGVLSYERAVRRVVTPLLQSDYGSSGVSVEVRRVLKTGSDAAPGVLVLDDERARFARVFRLSKDAELSERGLSGQVIGELTGRKARFLASVSRGASHG